MIPPPPPQFLDRQGCYTAQARRKELGQGLRGIQATNQLLYMIYSCILHGSRNSQQDKGGSLVIYSYFLPMHISNCLFVVLFSSLNFSTQLLWQKDTQKVFEMELLTTKRNAEWIQQIDIDMINLSLGREISASWNFPWKPICKCRTLNKLKWNQSITQHALYLNSSGSTCRDLLNISLLDHLLTSLLKVSLSNLSKARQLAPSPKVHTESHEQDVSRPHFKINLAHWIEKSKR